MQIKLTDKDVLIIVDVQNDFLPGGRLAVSGGDQIIPALNQYIGVFSAKRLLICVSRDWHPVNHCSFIPYGGRWPVHCVAGSSGARFPKNLELPPDVHIISKATLPDKEAYSAFSETQLYPLLQAFHIERVFLGGLATEFCVLNTVKDAIQNRFTAFVLEDAICAINQQPGDGLQAIADMKHHGARFICFKEIVI